MPQTEAAPQTAPPVAPQSTAHSAATPGTAAPEQAAAAPPAAATPQTAATVQPAAGTQQAAVGSQQSPATAQGAAGTQAAAAQTAVVPQVPVEKQPHSFATFSGLVTLVIVLILFCYGYFHVRRQRSIRQIDEKAGDEGED